MLEGMRLAIERKKEFDDQTAALGSSSRAVSRSTAAALWKVGAPASPTAGDHVLKFRLCRCERCLRLPEHCNLPDPT